MTYPEWQFNSHITYSEWATHLDGKEYYITQSPAVGSEANLYHYTVGLWESRPVEVPDILIVKRSQPAVACPDVVHEFQSRLVEYLMAHVL